MSINKKAIETLFSEPEHLEKIFTDAIYLAEEQLEESSTFEEAIDVLMTRFNIIASEYVASALFGYDFNIYYENHNDELTADILQNLINSRKRVSKKQVIN